MERNSKIDPVILNNAAEWSEHLSADGQIYYYNGKTSESVWTKPEALRNLNNEINPVVLNNAAEWSEHFSPDGKMYYYNSKTFESVWENQKHLEILKVRKIASANLRKEGEQRMEQKLDSQFNPTLSPKLMNCSNPDVGLIKRKYENLQEPNKMTKIYQNPKIRDKTRPVSCTHFEGTSWCVVWTGDGKVFF